MKICITSRGGNLESEIDPRFGRCSYFIIWDYANDVFEAIANPNIDAGSGAGIQSAQLVVNKGVSVVITGEIGPKAEQIFKDAKLKIVASENGNIKEIIEKYRSNDIKSDIGSQYNCEEDVKAETGLFRRLARKCFGLGNRRGRGYGGCGGRGMRVEGRSKADRG